MVLMISNDFCLSILVWLNVRFAGDDYRALPVNGFTEYGVVSLNCSASDNLADEADMQAPFERR